MSKTFYIFRHGETQFSKTNTPYGEHELTAEILSEAKSVIEKLAKKLAQFPIDAAFRSEFLRCKQTAEIIEANTKLHFEPEPLLNEFTESGFDVFRERMEELVQKFNDLTQTHIAICTHGANVAALKRLLLGKEFNAHELMYYPKTGVILIMNDETIEEIDCNL